MSARDRLIERRFWSKVRGGDVATCWLWNGSKNTGGYGKVRVHGTLVQAHRWAYESLRAPVPAGLNLDHLCRNRACVNPWHLEPVSGRINTLRGAGHTAINAAKTHCVRGHRFDAENTRWSSNGYRVCRACVRLRGISQRTATSVGGGSRV
ncbi:HNH endonuclease [Streptomyces sp. NPDC096153]|uniref:HNH endonuclease n=1 Tax=Streptomyces sp. NPDC096153 TaxID=3155548 RepID=UPI003318B203